MRLEWSAWRQCFARGAGGLACVTALALAGCSGSRPKAQPASAPETALHHGPITDFVPAAGLRWMLVARPKELWSNQVLRRGVEKLFPNDRLTIFTQQSGIDLRQLGAGCVAGFDIGTLYLAETTDAVDRAKRAFLARLASEPLTKHPGPGVTHITGIIGLTPESFVGLEGRLVGVSVKDPTLTKIVGAFALGKLKKSPAALDGAALRELPKSLAVDPLQFYVPGPFTEEWAKGAGGLLGRSIAVGISARLVNREAAATLLDVQAILIGDYGENASETIQRALATFQELTQSGLGRVLSLRDESVAPEILATRERVTLRVRLPLERLLDGLYAAVAANVWEMLDYKPR